MKPSIRHLFAVVFVLALPTVAFAAESAGDLIDKGKVFERKFKANEALPLYL